LDKVAAVREASLTRLRPVLMTTASTVLGHVPLVLVSGPGAEARNSIGTVLVAGMSVGTLFTLVVVPVFYTLIAARHAAGEESDEREAETGTHAGEREGLDVPAARRHAGDGREALALAARSRGNGR
jgi:multidrug efflux pump